MVRIDKFFRDSIILTISNTVTGVIAFFFSIVLSRELGAEGLGLYGLIIPVYVLLLCLTSDGMVTASSKISTLYFSRKDYRNLNKTTTSLFVYILLCSTSVAALLLLTHHAAAIHLVRDVRASAALMVLSPALIFVPLSAVIKGFFYGLGNYKVTAVIDIVEKLLRVVLLLGTISALMLESVEDTVAAAAFALACGEFVSLILLYTFYRIQKKKLKGSSGKPKSRIQLLFDAFVISFPLGVNGILSSILTTISALVLPRRLMSAGFTYSDALAMTGKFNGMALNISYLPFIAIGSMLTVLVPELSLNLSRKDLWSAEERISQVLRLSGAVGVATAIVCLIVPGQLGQLFYHRTDLTEMIRFSAVLSLISFVASPTFGILNALGKQNVLLKNSLLISVESLILIFLLAGIPGLHIYGYGISMIVTSVTALVINVREIRKVCEIKIGLQDIVTLALSGIAVYLAAQLAAGITSDSGTLVQVIAVVTVSFGTVASLYRVTARYRDS